MDDLNALLMDVQRLEELTLNRTERRHFITKGCIAFEDECLRHTRDLRRGIHFDLPTNMKPWIYGV